MHWRDLEQRIATQTGKAFKVTQEHAVGGGCINSAYKISGQDRREFFVKFNRAERLDMFEAEAEGLRELQQAQAVCVPAPLATGISGQQAYMVMEYIPLGGGSDAGLMRHFGRQLAALHQYRSERFGWHRDNTIGATAQPNPWDHDWRHFWRSQRLGHQLALAKDQGYPTRALDKGERLLARLDDLFDGYAPQASLVHGDLWGGNFAASVTGEPVIFDPAVYYGDREVDLAMTELFGGFTADFYAAYTEAWPLDAGYKIRKILYNLYHVLNHYHLFGGAYGQQAEAMLDRLLGEIGAAI
ncbi:MAG: fructosamine kinase family protein [Gammaproteobacteria bacterium]